MVGMHAMVGYRKKFGKRRKMRSSPYQRVSFKGTPYKLAGPNLRYGGLEGLELKFLDTSVSATAIVNTSGLTGGKMDWEQQ